DLIDEGRACTDEVQVLAEGVRNLQEDLVAGGYSTRPARLQKLVAGPETEPEVLPELSVRVIADLKGVGPYTFPIDVDEASEVRAAVDEEVGRVAFAAGETRPAVRGAKSIV
ncbi:MAG: hypothetical protein AB1700_18450, partial [Bacillota bacterium]